jgi:hypothetical protein
VDYWLSKFMYDLQNADLRAQFRADPEGIIGRYPLKPDVRQAALDGNIPFLQPLVNAYLLRFYFGYLGMGDAEFISTVRTCAS